MQLRTARVTGYQSFADSGEVRFERGVNLIVGQNNVGKSAFLRALQPGFSGDKHRTPNEWRDAALPSPVVSLTLEVSGTELREAAFQIPNGVIIPAPSSDPALAVQYVNELLEADSIPISLQRRPGSPFTASQYPSHARFFSNGQGLQVAGRLVAQDGTLSLYQHNNGEDTLPLAVDYLWGTRMFYFGAERFSIGQTNTAHVERLDQNASNLAAVLATLSGDRGDLFDRLVEHLREIFPTVGNLSTRIQPGSPSVTEVRVWPTQARSNVALSFPLTQSGTGVAQIMALLTAIMTVDNAVIIVDEINSFLHPAAVKALIRILHTEYSHHQYIISTHAPEVVGFANPSTIHLVKRSSYDSIVCELNPGEVGTLREVASHLGVSMSDVFAADRVIWVEGETEEAIFPFLFREALQPLPPGTIFTTVAATGDFGAKRRDRSVVFEAYSRLTQAVATLPVKVVFGFDTETLTDKEKLEMVRDSGGRLHFLPRRHLECYLLDPVAISNRLKAKDPESTVKPNDVENKILTLGGLREFQVAGVVPGLGDDAWLSRVNAAKLLVKLFNELSETRVTYDKVADGIELVKLIVKDNPTHLAPLTRYVRELVDAVQSDDQA